MRCDPGVLLFHFIWMQICPGMKHSLSNPSRWSLHIYYAHLSWALTTFFWIWAPCFVDHDYSAFHAAHKSKLVIQINNKTSI